MLNYKTLASNGVLLVLITLLVLLNFYSETLFYRPTSIHQWRQADCLSITKNYYEEGMHFFSPKIHSLRAPGGKAVSEFPLLNYTAACLWKVFGEHEFIYRLMEYFIYLVAIFILFNTLLRFFAPGIHLFFMVSVLLTSPLLTYYSFNFISDVPALSFCIISFCLLFSFYKTGAMRYFYAALLFATLAVLLKASALIALASLIFFSIIDLLNLNRWFGFQKLFRSKIVPVLSILLSIFLIDAWYKFAVLYNTYNNGFFLLTILPIWEMDEDSVFWTLRLLFNNLLPTFLNRPMLALFFFLVIFVIVHFKKLDVFLRYCFVFAGLFFILYLLIFFRVFTVHDYYLVNLFIFPVITFFCLADIITKADFKMTAYLRAAMIILIVFNGFYSAAFYRMRMINDDKMSVWYPFISREEKEFFDYHMWSYGNGLRPLETIRPELRKLGIKREDIVLSVTDESPNISLYFMDQKGYAFSPEQFSSDSLSLKKMLPAGVKYLVLTNHELRKEKAFEAVAPYFESIFKGPRIEIFKRKTPEHAV